MAIRDKRISETRTSSRAHLKQQAAAADKHTTASQASPMHAERLKNLYAAMLKCRALADVICAHGGDQGCRGYEAIIAGAAIHLKQHDFVAPSEAETFARFVQGSSSEPSTASIQQKKKEVRGAIAVNRPSTTAVMNIATGMALACKLQKNGLITLFVSAGTEHSVSFAGEAIHFAATRKLPIVFVIGPDLISARSEPEDLRSEAQDLLPVITVDGVDAVAVYRVAEECTRRVRQGLGPSLIHYQIDAERDPILFMESYLRRRDLWSEAWKNNLLRDCSRQAELVASRHPRPSTAGRKLATAVR